MAVNRKRLVFPFLAPFYDALEPYAWTLLRVTLGVWLILHGYGKLFGHDAVFAARNFVKFGWPDPLAWGYFIGCVEFFGGISLAIGFLTRLAAAMFVVEMAVISFAVVYPNWFWNQRGMEYPLLMGIVALALAIRGGGPLSLDNNLPKEL